MDCFRLMFVLSGLAIFSTPALAADRHVGMAAATVPAAGLSDGSVKKIDKVAGKLTIAHGPLANLGMPPMTMGFKVRDKVMLDRVKVGDKVRFRAEDDRGVFVVTHIEVVNIEVAK